MKTKTTILLLYLTFNVMAQDPTFSQFNSVPLYFNPGYAGSIEKPRFALSYRNQWSSRYQTTYISYDQAIKRIHGGIGLLVYNDRSKISGNTEYLNTLYCGLAYAAKFNLFNKIAISPAIKVGYRKDDVNFKYSVMSNGFIDPMVFKATKNNIDVSLGGVINTEKFHAGFSIDHINEPNISLLGGISRLPRKYVAQAGYTFQKNDNSNFSVSPSILYQQQQYSQLLQSNLSFRYKFVIIGLGFTTGSSSNFMLGYYSKKIIIGYSLEQWTNKSNVSPGFYTHEISFRYFFSLKKKNKEVSTEKK